MTQNNCTPQNVYGPFTQTLFLGCSISSFSASVGWNEQVSEVTVQLVRDTCAPAVGSTKTYFNNLLEATNWDDIDPGFYGVNHLDPADMVTTIAGITLIGLPVYFRVANFEFSGLIQSWEERKDTNGNPIYIVKIVDPREILDGAQLIVSNYSGSVSNIPNLLNVFGYFESLVQNCSFNESYGKVIPYFYGGYGTAQANDNGMPWNNILAGIHQLTASVPRTPNAFSVNGRLVYRGLITHHTMGLMSADEAGLCHYLVDITQLPLAPNYYRFAGPGIGLLDAIKNVCSDTGADFCIELLPTVDTLGNIWKIIKVRASYRYIQPNLTFIDAAIGDSTGLVNSSKGQESRNELCSQFIIGGNKEAVFEMIQDFGNGESMIDDIIAPFWGLNANGEAIETYRDITGEMYFYANIEALNAQLYTALAVTEVEIRELELKMALGGFDSWLSWSSMISRKYTARPTIWKAFMNANVDAKAKGIWDLEHVANILALVGEKELAPHDLLRSDIQVFRGREDLVEKDLQGIFNFIELYAKEYYGRKYMVRIPFVCHTTDSESGQVIPSEEPTDSGWIEEADVLGLPLVPLEFFKNDQGKVEPFFKFNDVSGNKLDFTNVSADEYGFYNNAAYVKANIEPRLVYINESPRVVMSIGQAVLRKLEDDNIAIRQKVTQGLALLINEELGAGFQDICLKVMQTLGGVGLSIGAEHHAHTPTAAAVTLKSNIITYGPYYVSGPPGKVVVEQDEGLVPWEYDGIATMNLAGLQKATHSLTQMQIGEMGSLTIAGYPDKPLGGELGANTTTFLFENRSVNEGATYDVPMDMWTGVNGPNITGISVDVGTQGVQTTYTMRTFTPQFGRFSRYNAERLKSVAKQRARYNRLFRLKLIPKQKVLTNLLGQKSDKRGPFSNNNRGTHQDYRQSPHEVLVAEMIDLPNNSEGYKRTIVASVSMKDMIQEFEGYENKAFMSWDGLVRPIQVNATGGPRFPYLGGTTINSNIVLSPQPPVSGNGPGGIVYAQYPAINNPLSGFHSTPAGSGHDLEILGRGTGVPSGGMVMPIAGYATSAKSDYSTPGPSGVGMERLMALRGPMIMTGWGYDVNGKPVPNASDTDDAIASGVWATGNLADGFLEDFMRKPQTWPVGTVDLRWDRYRRMWVAPQQRRLLHVKAAADFNYCGQAYANGTAYLVTGEPLWDMSGNAMPYGNGINSPTIPVRALPGAQPIYSGDEMWAYFNEFDYGYYAIEKPETDELYRFRLDEAMPYAHPLDCNSGSGVAATLLGWSTTAGSGYQPGRSITLSPVIICGEYQGFESGLDKQWGPAVSGFHGICKFDRRNCRYTIVQMDNYAQFISFTLTTGIDGAHSPGQFLSTDYTVDRYWEGMSPGNSMELCFNDAPCYPQGYRGIATFNRASGWYEVINTDAPLFIRNSGVEADMGISTINFTSGLITSSGEICSIDVGHPSLWSGDIVSTVIRAVSCSGSTLSVTTGSLTFDIYGHLKATG